MTPERRFKQIELVLADVVQKVDCLIEGIDSIIEEVSNIPGIVRTVSITAKPDRGFYSEFATLTM